MSQQLTTRLIHVGAPPFKQRVAPVNVPVVRTSTVRFDSVHTYDELHQRRAEGEAVSVYGRHGMDTHRALEEGINALEGGERSFLVPSGLAAISLTFLALLSPGEHALVSDSVYAPVRRLDKELLRCLGMEISYFSPGQDQIEQLIRPNTRLLYVESPNSLLYEVLDLPQLAEIARRHGLILAADNTWGSGLLYQPLQLGAQVSVLAATKYISGHSDLMLGVVVVKDEALAARIAKTYDNLGLSVGADDAYLALRGLRTLAVVAARRLMALGYRQVFVLEQGITTTLRLPSWPTDLFWPAADRQRLQALRARH